MYQYTNRYTVITGLSMFCSLEQRRFVFSIIFSSDIIVLENISLPSSHYRAMADGSPRFFSMFVNASASFSSLILIRCARTISVIFDMEVVCGCFNCPLKNS